MKNILKHEVVSQDEMDKWPVDRARSGEKCWAETTWGTGNIEGLGRLFNWNIWPCRVVFDVKQAVGVVRGRAVWRRSKLSIRMKGLKLVAASTGQEVSDAVVLRYDQEAVEIDFAPGAGPGIYHLYYGANERQCFDPSPGFMETRSKSSPVEVLAERIQARCRLDDFDEMEQIALDKEVKDLLDRHSDNDYMVFPEDRDHSIKLQFEIPAKWALDGPAARVDLDADRNEYRVFQLGVWACRREIPDIAVEFSDLVGPGGTVVESGRMQCLTLESRCNSRYIVRPSGHCRVPKGEVRALWCGIDLPVELPAGEYTGEIHVNPEGLAPTVLPLTLRVSENNVEERGDHDHWRLSRLRWIDSDAGLSDSVHAPFAPLEFDQADNTIRTWGHEWRIGDCGLPEALTVRDEEVLAAPVCLGGIVDAEEIKWEDASWKTCVVSDAAVEWAGSARHGSLGLGVSARMEYDGSIVFNISLTADKPCATEDLFLTVSWQAARAWLASGMGYRGKRDGNRAWRWTGRSASAPNPGLWMGSVDAGLAWLSWLPEPRSAGSICSDPQPWSCSGEDNAGAWSDIERADAATVTEEGETVELRLNMGTHRVTPESTWRFSFALLPTPVKPMDPRHWRFRYSHKGGGFRPSSLDTPRSFLKDDCRRLDEFAQELGVKRLNLHDWWGPAFNYAWQWDGSDNLSRLTEEAHKRGVFVKVYNSGRELSNLAPEFWAFVYEGTNYRFRPEVEADPRVYFQDAWRQNHLPDGLSTTGWPRLHTDLGNEHSIPVSNATRIGNFYLESMRYMTRFFGTDGAYWDGADGPFLGHREMAKRLRCVLDETNHDAVIDVHHGHNLLRSPITDHILCMPFIDSIWHGEGFDYERFDPWAWLVEIAGIPFNVPSEMLGGEKFIARGMLFGIWPRHGWCCGTDVMCRLWSFFDTFGIEQAEMTGWWEGENGITVDRPDTLVTVYRHPSNGVFLALASWELPLASWLEMSFDVSLCLDRSRLGLPDGKLRMTDVLSDEDLDPDRPIVLPEKGMGRLLWLRQ